MVQCGMCESWVHARCEGLSGTAGEGAYISFLANFVDIEEVIIYDDMKTMLFIYKNKVPIPDMEPPI